MLHEIHDHINQEVRINTRTDTIFVITAIVFNFAMLGASSALAASAADEIRGVRSGFTSAIVLAITFTISVLVNGIAITGLLTGRATRKMLSEGLLTMYEDTDVSKYYQPTLLTNYMRRYTMFVAIVGVLGLASIAIPLVVLLTS